MNDMPFENDKIKLQGHKMIEASAGTGKTFSLAMLVLRTLIEPDEEIGLNKILMVTFTNSAVAELEIRVRRFIREAYNYVSNRDTTADKEIIGLIDGYKQSNHGITPERILERLGNAIQSLDELNVFTIHSFCQKTLEEFSFETNSKFNSEIIADESDLIESVINEFWRNEINGLTTEQFQSLSDFFKKGNTKPVPYLRGLFTTALNNRLDNKTYEHSAIAGGKSVADALKQFHEKKKQILKEHEKFVNENFNEIVREADKKKKSKDLIDNYREDFEGLTICYYNTINDTITGYIKEELFDLLKEYGKLVSGQIDSREFNDYFKNNIDTLSNKAESDVYAVKFLNNLDIEIQNNRPIEEELSKKISAGYIKNNFGGLYARTLERIISEIELNNESKSLILEILLFKLLLDTEGDSKYYLKVARIKNARNHIGYDDMISKVHGSIDKVSEVLQRKYDVIFIDEFQDTDKLQYEIFSRVFKNKLAVFIGDPKQSIYGWRKADLNMYKRARESIRNKDATAVESMDRNFRSTPGMLKALNMVFSSVENFFLDEEIEYRNVSSGNTELGNMLKEGEEVIPIEVILHNEETLKEITNETKINKEDYDKSIVDFVAGEAEKLLFNGQYSIKGNPVKPSDIGILVRTNKQARDIKNALSLKGIHAITLDETPVLDSPEARHLLLVMTATNRPSRKTINSALLNRNFGFGSGSMLAGKNDEEILDAFDNLRNIWKDDGVFVMLTSFMDTFGVRHHCIESEKEGGLRSLSNYYQLIEMLHEYETRGKLSEEALISRFLKAISNKRKKGDESVQRLESDEDAVKIVTIHKAKGLEYNIVFAPFLDLTAWTKEFVEYQNPETGQYFFSLDDNGEKREMNLEAIRQENRRLMYVALTRARYKCYINVNGYPKLNGSSLGPVIESLKTKDTTDLIDIKPVGSQEPVERKTTDDDTVAVITARGFEGIEHFIQSRDIHSFSSLSRKHDVVTSEPREIEDDYENFVFNELPRGAKAGLFLHRIFELLDFTNEESYRQTVESAGAYYSTVYRGEHLKHYTELVRHCMNAPVIDCNGNIIMRLNEIKQTDKLPEMEFYFNLDNHNKNEIVEIIPEVMFTTDYNVEGIMHGFIDLLFRHKGKYYVLDWKSNFLGNKVEDYNREGLEEGMRGSNYHLQYSIYTVAVKRYLESKLNDFDYERDFGGVIYVFLRGVRENREDTGIYFEKPRFDQIDRLESLFFKQTV